MKWTCMNFFDGMMVMYTLIPVQHKKKHTCFLRGLIISELILKFLVFKLIRVKTVSERRSGRLEKKVTAKTKPTSV